MSRNRGEPVWEESAAGVHRVGLSEVDLWRLSLAEHRPASKSMYELLDQNERNRAGAYRFEHLRERYILRHGLLRLILAEYLNQRPSDIRIDVSATGKPYVRDNSLSNIEFNLSDCDDLAMVAVSRGQSVGVDIERVRRDKPAFEIVSEFAPDERRAIESTESPQQRSELLYQIWVRKEAYLKARAVGMSVPLDSFSVSPLVSASGITWNLPTITDSDSCVYTGFDFDASDDCIGAVVGCGPIGRVRFYQASAQWMLRTSKSYDEIST